MSENEDLTPLDLVPNYIALAAWILVGCSLDNALARLCLNEPEPLPEAEMPVALEI